MDINQFLDLLTSKQWIPAFAILATFLAHALHEQVKWFPKSVPFKTRMLIVAGLTITSAALTQAASDGNLLKSFVAALVTGLPGLIVLVFQPESSDPKLEQ